MLLIGTQGILIKGEGKSALHLFDTVIPTYIAIGRHDTELGLSVYKGLAPYSITFTTTEV